MVTLALAATAFAYPRRAGAMGTFFKVAPRVSPGRRR
jgi:hypothetical protein